MSEFPETRWQALQDSLASVAQEFPNAVVASSLAAEDMVLTHALSELGFPLAMLTLDTGMLPAPTLALLETVRQHYGCAIEVWRPEEQALQHYVAEHGAYAFYESVALRKSCCQIRKVEPLRRALQGRGAWVTGQRRGQGVTREDLPLSEFDTAFGLQKFNPLAEWSHDEVWQLIRHFEIPYNTLHDQGYPSIGCDPCTRAVKPGEDLRAGRWWWESSDSKECGLHGANLQRNTVEQETQNHG
ncbi:phosphoadenylyl-sulfate reductase [Pusillimonas sp. CC-YST705]|uniref:Adenosine 5'-phosphosulfate reductase n=1 Tax=Mesopusillimonas faecipullorum TaxID=2755040 RepID=A0ABS8CEL2_9BURK|nr:phosphoadenylyl-sulfate reductase [Mesopusillimonas faecipullorum]MCB5364014.1 phosphoadenylyl-sulfate reductase [Mesopusillimonas faecipullorum]